MRMTAMQLAEYTIRKARDREVPITNLKLQKTLYYIQGYVLRVFGEPAFDETICHWQYGPVVPMVYFAYSTNGAEPLTADEDMVIPALRKDFKKLCDKVIEKCLEMTARKLVDKTHGESPWLNTNEREVITHSEIERYFCEKNPLDIDLDDNNE